MMEQIEDEDGKVIAYIEYSLVNDKGVLDDNGTYIFVRRLWIWKQLGKGFSVIKKFIKTICEQFPNVKYGYWKDRTFDGPPKLYKREVIYGK